MEDWSIHTTTQGYNITSNECLSVWTIKEMFEPGFVSFRWSVFNQHQFTHSHILKSCHWRPTDSYLCTDQKCVVLDQFTVRLCSQFIKQSSAFIMCLQCVNLILCYCWNFIYLNLFVCLFVSVLRGLTVGMSSVTLITCYRI